MKKLIEINLKRVEEGKALTIPLAVLNGKFKEEYRKRVGEFEKLDKEELKAYQKAYHQKPEAKAHQKAYQKAYYQRPEVKSHKKAYQKAYYQKHKKLKEKNE